MPIVSDISIATACAAHLRPNRLSLGTHRQVSIRIAVIEEILNRLSRPKVIRVNLNDLFPLLQCLSPPAQTLEEEAELKMELHIFWIQPDEASIFLNPFPGSSVSILRIYFHRNPNQQLSCPNKIEWLFISTFRRETTTCNPPAGSPGSLCGALKVPHLQFLPATEKIRVKRSERTFRSGRPSWQWRESLQTKYPEKEGSPGAGDAAEIPSQSNFFPRSKF